jgi:hypothetical protein
MRCDDCFADFGDGDRFAVIKERTLTPDEALSSDPFAAALAKWQQAFVCGECQGWYSDPIQLTAIEAGHG